MNHLYDINEQIATITIKNPSFTCNAITRRNKITINVAPQGTPSIPNQYNLVDQLDKMPALISILELLRLSPSHRTILGQALQEASVPANLNID